MPSTSFDTFTRNHFQIKEDEYSLSIRFVQDLKIDSVDLVVYIMELEERFSIVIMDKQAEQIKTIRDARKLVLAEIQKKGNL